MGFGVRLISVNRRAATFTIKRAGVQVLAAGCTSRENGCIGRIGGNALVSQVLTAARAFRRSSVVLSAASRARGDARFARSSLEALAAGLAECPARLNRSRAARTRVQFACDAGPIDQRFATPLAVAQPFSKIYITSITVHA